MLYKWPTLHFQSNQLSLIQMDWPKQPVTSLALTTSRNYLPPWGVRAPFALSSFSLWADRCLRALGMTCHLCPLRGEESKGGESWEGGGGSNKLVVTERSRRPWHLGVGGKWKGKRDVSEWLASGTGCRLNCKKAEQQINGQAQN